MRRSISTALIACAVLSALTPAHARQRRAAMPAPSAEERMMWSRADGGEAAASVQSSRSRTARHSRVQNSFSFFKAPQPARTARATPRDVDTTASIPTPASAPSSAAAAPAAGGNLRAIVERHAAANGVPANVAHGVVMVESRYNPRATGPGGYIGLMQISYRTARGLGYTGSAAGLYDPDTNVRYGMKYFGDAWKMSGGNLCGAVSKYQGGHGVRGVTPAGAVYCGKVKGHMAAGDRAKGVKTADLR